MDDRDHDHDHDEWPDDDEQSMADCRRTHPCFTVTCDACGSRCVTIILSVGLADGDRPCAQVMLHCLRCQASHTLKGS